MSESRPTRTTWDQIVAILRRSVPRQQFETWFRGMRLVSLSPERAELTVLLQGVIAAMPELSEAITRRYFSLTVDVPKRVRGRRGERP